MTDTTQLPESTPLRDTIGYILNHNIIYSKQYEKIEYGKAGDELESLLDSEMGKFAEWLDNNSWCMYIKYQWMKADTEETATTEELVQLYKNRNKV